MVHYTRYIKNEFGVFVLEKGSLRTLTHKEKNRAAGYGFITFVLRTCGHLVGWPGFGGGSVEIKSWRKYDDGREIIQVNASKLPSRSEFIRDLSVGDHPFSKQTLEYALRVKNALIEKHQSADRSLDEILGS